MALPFKNIGKRINDFLKPKEYALNRTAKINVSSDKVNWSLENKLNSNGAIESELEVSHQFDQETLKLITSTIKAPKFEVKTKRIQSKFDVTASVQDPKLEINLCQKREKYALCIDSTYDWSNQNCDGEVAISYAGIDRMSLGAKAKVERSQRQQTLGVTDYNVGLQWDRNEDQTFAVTTENQIQKVKVGAEFKVRDNYRGFAEISYNTAAAAGADGDNKKEGPLGYSVGIRRELTATSHLRGVFRSNQTASVLYANNFTESNACGKIGVNFDFTKPPSQRASVEWKVIFGCGGSKSCCQ